MSQHYKPLPRRTRQEALRHSRGSAPPPPMALPTSTSTSTTSSSSFDPLLETVIIGGANVSQRNHRGFASPGIGTLVPRPLTPFTPRLHGRIVQALDSCLPRWLDISHECCLSCCFCGFPILSAATPTRPMVTDMSSFPFSVL